MQEDTILRLLGAAGAVGLLGQALHALRRRYEEEYRPHSMIFRLDLLRGRRPQRDSANGSDVSALQDTLK